MLKLLDARKGLFVEQNSTLFYGNDPDATWTYLDILDFGLTAIVKYLDGHGRTKTIQVPVRLFPSVLYPELLKQYTPEEIPWRIAVFPS